MARELKRTKTKLEKLIREVWSQTQKGSRINGNEEKFIVDAINKTLEYFAMHDYLCGENYTQIFEVIYLSSPKRISKIKVASSIPFSEPTIKRRCSEFIILFEKNLKEGCNWIKI